MDNRNMAVEFGGKLIMAGDYREKIRKLLALERAQMNMKQKPR